MKKLLFNIRSFFYYLFIGLRSADDKITVGGKIGLAEEPTINQQQESNNLYAQLLRGEITQEVIEARHEMYYAERRSHDYIYNGGGRAKLNKVFEYEGNVENSDGHIIQIVQDNKLDMANYEDYGIDINYNATDNVYGTIKQEDISKKEYTLKIRYPFIPKFRLEEYATKAVVKKCDNKRIVDLYFSKYPIEFNRLSRLFVNAITAIYMGDTRSELLDIESLSFVTKNAYGSDDLVMYSYKNFEFRDIIEFDGSYVLRFLCDVIDDGVDLIEEFYDEATAKKCEEHAPREGAEISLNNAQEIIDRDSYDVETAKGLLEDLK